jgi:hypothetical protein
VRDERGSFENHIFPVIGDLPLAAVTKREVLDLISELRAKGRKPKTIRNIHGALYARGGTGRSSKDSASQVAL